LSVRFNRTIIEGLQGIVVLIEAQLHPLVQAESSVIVDVLYRPEYLFQPGTEARKSVTMADSFAGKFDLYFMLTIDLLLGIYFY
jgi:hypothetical protein